MLKFIDDVKNLMQHTAATDKIGLIATKPVFGVSDKVRLKPVSVATETSLIIEIFACSKYRYETL